MRHWKHGDPIIEEAKEDFYNHKHPTYKNISWWWLEKFNKTMFDLLKNKTEEIIPIDCPVDDEGYISVDALFDFETWQLLTHLFNIINTYTIGEKVYHHIYVPSVEKTFFVDLKNKYSFPYIWKGIHWYARVKDICRFWDKEIIIVKKWFDEMYYIDSSWKKTEKDALNITKIENSWLENMDILAVESWRTADYAINDLGTVTVYIWSDWHQYKKIKVGEWQKFKKISKTENNPDGSITTLELS